MDDTLKIRLTKPGNLPYIDLYHDKSLYRFVLDTGSTLSWTTSEVAARFILEKESGYKTIVVNNGEQLPIVSATLRISPCTYTPEDYTATKFRAEFACGEGSVKIREMNEVLEHQIDGILGSDFLVDNALKLDLKEMTVIL